MMFENQEKPLYSSQAEQSVLGGLMLDNSKFIEVSEILIKSDFHHEEHQIIFAAISAILTEEKPADIITVSDELEKTGELQKIGGLNYLGTLANDTPSATNIVAYAEIVRDYAVLRALIDNANETIGKALNNGKKPVYDVINAAIGSLSGLLSRTIADKGGLVPIKTILSNAIDDIEVRFESDRKYPGMATGFVDFDEMFGGLPINPPEPVLIGGRPGMGKSTLMQNIVENIAIANKDFVIAIFSVEMPASQLILRMLASVGRIEVSKLISGKLDDSDWPRLTTALNLLATTNIFIDDSSYLTPAIFNSRLAKLKAKTGRIDLIAVDYLQIMTEPSCKNRVMEVTEISASLRRAVKEFWCPILELSQLNRLLESRSDKRPINSDIRESGAVEQDMGMIIFTYRDEAYNEDSRDKGIAEIIVGKNRNGKTGTIRLHSNLQFSRFDNAEIYRDEKL